MSNASITHPEPIIIPPSKPHTHTIILLHGLSTNGSIFSAQLLSTAINSAGLTIPQSFPGAKFIFPSGAPRRCTAFNNALMNVWFDVSTIDDRTVGEDEQIEGLRESSGYLCELISAEIANLEKIGRGEGNVVLWGFSQGCAIGAWVVLNGEGSWGRLWG
ncbi:hypothetical protein ABVK25_002055 [Lepraria finkii]|uniref:Phospholipase/carboxylesterase/thioesterase domain-containing protein n=1 Tax=Lepraria finkii TaxID=1340010 RepID=A0ABR4BIM1_9LECA